MNALISLHNALFDWLDRLSGAILPTLARFTFAAVLLVYFWKSAVTKMGDGLFGLVMPSDGAYVQIFPRAMEAVSYDSSQLGMLYWLVAVAGMWAEFLLPALVVLGLLGRLSAAGMIGFIIVQSATDIVGHGASDPKTLGAWFDGIPDSVILDQRLLWITVLLIIVIKGAGPLSVDRLLGRLA
ncbi:DoxX family membrane protein [Sedimentitalea nanhaiensis]|uniref:Putative oxidoreductase n=1 Tax=Sedimentitalea nanhaiensis TaxID=999627 RepID=A0A1I6ZG40_9RHOB|nr:DoxX family membrane protein [Sedimentitalea nanhaiensis]SFT61666.1 putative oxidoreductase [Sedimentitalea nanhaiensis]